MFLAFLLYHALSEYDLLEQAAQAGFFYRQVAIEETALCPLGEFCLTRDGTMYRFRRLEQTRVHFTTASAEYAITVEPDPSFSTYRLYVRDRETVRRTEITTRTIRVRDGGTIISLQIVAVGAVGPVVIWQRDVRPVPRLEWKGDLLSSMNAVREKAGILPLVADESLRPMAQKAMERVREGAVVHYSGREGSIAHSGVRADSIGENLFIAATPERAWHLMTSSPAHLFNILTPSFRRCWVEQTVSSAGDMVRGVVLFTGGRLTR